MSKQAIKTEYFPQGVPGGASIRGIPFATWRATDETTNAVGVGKSEVEALADLEGEQSDCWDAIMADPALVNARDKLSIHEFRLIIKHVKAEQNAIHDEPVLKRPQGCPHGVSVGSLCDGCGGKVGPQ